MEDDKALAEKAGPVARLHGRETLIAHLPCESWPFGPSVWETEVQIEDRRGLASEIIGPPVRPHDVPDMSVLETAHWIASKGGAVDFEVSDETIWNSSVRELLDKVRSEETEVSGHSSEGKCAEPVPAYKFRGKIRIEHPYQSTRDPNESAFNDEPTLDLGGYGGDKLCEENHRIVSRDLRISGREVARLWPFGMIGTPTNTPAPRKKRRFRSENLAAELRPFGINSKAELDAYPSPMELASRIVAARSERSTARTKSKIGAELERCGIDQSKQVDGVTLTSKIAGTVGDRSAGSEVEAVRVMFTRLTDADFATK
jgi:hypothetical protein